MTPLRMMMTALVLLSATTGCKTPDAASDTKGHLEDSTLEERDRFRNQQSLVSEYLEVESVVISTELAEQYLLGTNGFSQLVRAIVRGGAKVLLYNKGYRNDREQQDFLDNFDLTARERREIEFLPASYGEQFWMRDFGPIVVWDANAKERRVIDLNYYYNRPQNDAFPQQFADYMGWDRISMRVYGEGGNIASNEDGFCVVSKAVLDMERFAHRDGDILLGEEEVREGLQTFGGCQTVYMPERMPHEGTGHVDLWIRFMSNQDVVIGQIESYDASEPIEADVARYLEDQADYFTDKGFRVRRIAQPAPWFDRSTGSAVVPTYINALQVNDQFIIPQYAGQEDYNRRARRSFGQYNYKNEPLEVTGILSDELIVKGGSIHCASMQIPAPLSESTGDIDEGEDDHDTQPADADCVNVGLQRETTGRLAGTAEKFCQAGDRIYFSSFQGEFYALDSCRSRNVSGFSGDRIEYYCEGSESASLIFNFRRRSILLLHDGLEVSWTVYN